MIEAMERLGVGYQLDDLSLKNLSGESTQILAKVKIIPKSSRFTRKIAVGNSVSTKFDSSLFIYVTNAFGLGKAKSSW